MKRASIVAMAFCAVGLIASGAYAQSPAPTAYAITHAKIYTLAGQPIDDGTLVIKDGKIAAVGASVEIPPGAQVIDAKGLEVYPGLFDPVTQVGLSEISAVRATVDSSEVGVFNPDVVAATAVNPSSEHIPVIRAAGITEALAVPGSGGFDFSGARGFIAGQASALSLSGWTMDEMQLLRSAAMVVNWPTLKQAPADSDDDGEKRKPYSEVKQEYEKKIADLTNLLEQARHYAQAAGLAQVERDLKLEALVPVVRGKLPLMIFADDARDIRNAVEFCEKQKIKIILAGGIEAYKQKDLLRSRSIPVVLRPVLTETTYEDDPYDRNLSQPAELSAAGVKFAFGSFDTSFARRLGQNAANAIAHGLSYDEGLKAVSLYPAQIFGLGDKVGSLEVGKIANVIVTNGDPLELTTELKFLFIRGELTSTDNRQKRLYEKYLNRPKP